MKINENVGRDIAIMFGPELTGELAEKGAAKLRAAVLAKAADPTVGTVVGANLADNVHVESRMTGWHHQIVLSVTGRRGTEVASHLEFGYVNYWAKRYLRGMHVMPEVASSLKL
ncbi:hypothetical protein [Bifidobacterium magnum]|uniref:hypothetical protein n=1 Tax=Bifidobacterium magnum TaxID=1692 RepID=UPI001269C61F|nr:hypothetical protein [Bifidobacterium magnum]